MSRRNQFSAAMMEHCEPRQLLSADVLTYHNDLSRTGANTAETQLTTSNVNPNTFGKKFQLTVDGQVYTQPLVVSGLAFARGHLATIHRNMVYVATQNDTVYAYDADRGDLIWAVRALGTSFGETAVPATDTGSDDLTPIIGITGTPVIDRSTNTLYVVSKAKRGSSTYIFRLYALDVMTGAKKFGGPIIIHPTSPGIGDGSDGTNITFDALIENQRPALTLVNGVVYVGFASHGDMGPYHGWVVGYDASTLAEVKVWNDTPNGSKGGIWQSGGGFAADASGNLYIPTGNGTFDADTAGSDFGDSIVNLPTTGAFTPTDFFTPFNQADLESQDADFGSTGVLLLPDQTGAHPHELIVGGKEGKLYLVDRDSMGGFTSGGPDDVVQTIPADGRSGGYDSLAYFNGNVYYGANHSSLEIFSVQNGTLVSNTPVTDAIPFPGVNPSISANGTSNGIAWIVNHVNGQAILQAYTANLTSRLYSSNLSGKRDRAGTYVKFSTPTIANGKVFIGTDGTLDIYGLL